MISYLKMYSIYNTLPASDKSYRTEVLSGYYPSNRLLKLDINQVVYIDEPTINYALEPRFIHPGKLTANFNTHSFLKKQFEEDAMQLNLEVIRTKAFVEIVSQLLQEFNIGHIQLPEPLKQLYSLFDHSFNDMCIVHKTPYKSNGKVTGGGLFCLMKKQLMKRRLMKMKERQMIVAMRNLVETLLVLGY